MVYHDWSDKSFDWEGLDGAIQIIINTTTRFGRFGGEIKEKFGCVRFYVSFNSRHPSLHGFIYPGYVYNLFPKWLWNLDFNVFQKILKPFSSLIWWWEKKVYNYAYQKAVSAYPHLREEILHSADHLELIKGTKDIRLGWKPFQGSYVEQDIWTPEEIEELRNPKKKIDSDEEG